MNFRMDHYIRLNGITLRYRKRGHGPEILMVHGCPGSVEDWDPILPDLVKKFSVTLFDRPGHGWSQGGENLCTLEYNAEVAFQLIEALDLKDVLIVGHSYGAATALKMVVQNPKNISGIVLVGSPGYAPVEVDTISILFGMPCLGRLLATILVPTIGPSYIRQGLRRGFSPNDDLIQEEWMELRIKLWAQTKVALTRARELLNLEEELEEMKVHYKKIQKKVVIVQGEEDDITKAAWALHQDIPNSNLTVFKGTGHYVQFVHPSQLTQIIEEARDTIV